MTRSVIIAAVLVPAISCSESSQSSQIQSFSRADHYVVDRNFGFHETLDKRMSLISKANQRRMYTLLGDDEPIIMALSAPQHLYSVEGSSYSYLKPENALLFTIGPKINYNSYDYSELMIYGTDKAVGYVYFGSSGGYPYGPYSLTHLCTGAYERVCTLSFNEEKVLFEIKLNPEGAGIQPN